ncbi:MAG: imidazoleglycerol-phosphate dehydratase HisB [Baileyella intestinalis]|jgi:imidazoleglycerol-phosphate dehydratase|uniref:Imidazoleglycerol-phosphate dehydratase n=1 Tax=Baileyella intestinalis TaxID=2606709 RepID=A0A6A8MAK9_9FIRM|nr:imidazoleglycerol-phosphate dehydratase HisB [Baileyella intestinalis]MDD5875367.1 imidazoleglycerol-phosphate dehydratase HisB [Baileyella intestinalis]MST68387.1 imidazoleglycerol-phosphate dehydratase HisB [Baileyella intestinalis]
MRNAEINRETAETKISLWLDLDGTGKTDIATGCGFMDHMLTLFAAHGRFDLMINASGDTYVDYHHLTEDLGICMGQAFDEALGDKRGITRYGTKILPMDEALILTSVDISGRAFLDYRLEGLKEKVGDFDTELAREFVVAMVRNGGFTLHVRQLAGENTHHILEGMFKSLGRSMAKAVKIEKGREDEIPSTKGMI